MKTRDERIDLIVRIVAAVQDHQIDEADRMLVEESLAVWWEALAELRKTH